MMDAAAPDTRSGGSVSPRILSAVCGAARACWPGPSMGRSERNQPPGKDSGPVGSDERHTGSNVDLHEPRARAGQGGCDRLVQFLATGDGSRGDAVAQGGGGHVEPR